MLENINLTNKQKEFLQEILTEDYRINLLEGSVRSGKTYISLIAWILLIITDYSADSQFLMVGKTLTSLKRNCLSLMSDFCSDFKYSLSKKEAYLFGRKIYLEGVNDTRAESKIRGMTLQSAYCDELTLFTEDFFSMLLSRLSMPNSKLISTTNPDTPHHWLMTKYINRKDELSFKVWRFLLDDNTSIPLHIRESMKKEYTGVFYDRFILGKWVSAEGVIYRSFIDNKQELIVDKLDEMLAFISVGIDYGASKSKTVFTASGITRGFENVYILKEKSFLGVNSPETIYDYFESFYSDILKEFGRISLVCADYGALGEVLTKGLNNRCVRKNIAVKIKNCTKTTINDRIQLSCKLFSQKRLKIMSSCKGTIEAFENAVWEKNKLDTRLDNGTIEIDYLDAFEYSINEFINTLINAR